MTLNDVKNLEMRQNYRKKVCKRWIKNVDIDYVH